MNTVHILGNNFACLMLADKCSKIGMKVCWFLDGGKAGGHFHGIELDGIALNIGMVQLEKPSGTASNDIDLKKFKPEKPKDWLNYSAQINEAIDKLFNPILTNMPEMFFRGQTFPDFFVSDRLDILQSMFSDIDLPPSSGDPKHARWKGQSANFLKINYEEASLYNHGQEIHQSIIMPYLAKLTNIPTSKLMAYHHRSAWLPLFWHSTILATLKTQHSTLGAYPFYEPCAGNIASITRQLEHTVRCHANVDVIDAKITNAKIQDGKLFVTTENNKEVIEINVVGSSEKRLAELLGLPKVDLEDRASIAFGVFEISKKALGEFKPPFINVVDQKFSTFRLSFQKTHLKPESYFVVCEAVANSGQSNSEKLQANQLKREVSLIANCNITDIEFKKLLNAQGVLPLPSFSNVSLHDQQTTNFKNILSDVELTGSLLGYGHNSMNEQICQALRIAAIYSV